MGKLKVSNSSMLYVIMTMNGATREAKMMG